ncbi:DUF3618 domain-containing protein [Marinactinospora thermotolerans]|uniref:DUF3618 domain-containing protein n=1 Tax=Marinactinospora thermotolerans DSM 45154 TaxID=1122192 RepID=A0A1T4T359_9ACTN|nr:DUF3618 domain-containing protein [Marinactinospora thermotolerans]SKA34739.1 Protein of unknown function [Marinactinospora thermotolerans DSM 45154]
MSHTRDDTPDETTLVREEISRTREELGETVEALAAKADVKSRAKESASRVAHTVRSGGGAGGDEVRRVAVALATGVLAAAIVALCTRGRNAR